MTRGSCWFGVALGAVIGMALLVFSLISNMSCQLRSKARLPLPDAALR
jgi:hypothetical protein